jgi:hypothetical protein
LPEKQGPAFSSNPVTPIAFYITAKKGKAGFVRNGGFKTITI